MDVSLTAGHFRVTYLGGSMRCKRKEVAERGGMFKGEGAFPRQPIHSGKDLCPGITGQQGCEFIQRAGADPSELLVDDRFDRTYLYHIVLSPTTRNE